MRKTFFSGIKSKLSEKENIIAETYRIKFPNLDKELLH